MENVPDPKDTDPVWYAIVAGITEALASSANERIDLGIRRKDDGIAARRA